MTLYFFKFVTDRAIHDFVTLSDFYKSRISGSCAIRFFTDREIFEAVTLIIWLRGAMMC